MAMLLDEATSDRDQDGEDEEELLLKVSLLQTGMYRPVTRAESVAKAAQLSKDLLPQVASLAGRSAWPIAGAGLFGYASLWTRLELESFRFAGIMHPHLHAHSANTTTGAVLSAAQESGVVHGKRHESMLTAALMLDAGKFRASRAAESSILLAYVTFYILSVVCMLYSLNSKVLDRQEDLGPGSKHKYAAEDIEIKEYNRSKLNWLAVSWASRWVARWGQSVDAALTKIKAEDLPQLGLREWQTHESGTRVEELWAAQVEKVGLSRASLVNIIPTLWGWKVMLAIFLTQALRFFICQLYTVILIEQALKYFSWLQDYVEEHGEPPSLVLPMLASILAFGSLPVINVCTFSLGSKLSNQIDQQLVGGIGSALYRKAQRLPSTSKNCRCGTSVESPGSTVASSTEDPQEDSSKDLMTLVNYDVTMQLPGFFESLCCCINGFFGLCVLLTMLWARLKLAVFVVMLCALPGVAFTTSRSVAISAIMREFQDKVDKRVVALREVLFGIRVVKCYAWEEAMEERISNLRNQELCSLAKYYRALGIAYGAFLSFPRLLIWAGLWGYSAIYGHQDTVTIFTCMVILGGLRASCELFSNALSRVVCFAPTIHRVENYLRQPEAPLVIPERVPDWVELCPDNVAPGEADLVLQGSFSWGLDGTPSVSSLAVTINKGELVAVLGEVGAGKSTLLHAFLGELQPVYLGCSSVSNSNGTDIILDTGDESGVGGKSHTGSPLLRRPRTVAYCPQVPHIAEGSVRENILFGKEFDEERYAEAVFAASLNSDLKLLTGGDQTMIGARGICLSGGQKARVGMARAAYSRCTGPVLLDDPFGAVDAPTAEFLLDNLLLGHLLADRTRVVIMQPDGERLQHFDRILILEGGQIVEQGAPEKVMSTKAYQRLLSSQAVRFEEDAAFAPSPTAGRKRRGRQRNSERNQAKVKETAESIHAMAAREDEAEGRPTWDMLKQYIAIGRWRNLICFVLIFSTQIVLYLVCDMVLVAWTNSMGWNAYVRDRPFLLGYLFWLGIATMTWFIAWNFGTWFTLRISDNTHSAALHRILRAPIDEFFDKHPVGRIMNRLHSDVNMVDLNLFTRFFGSFATIVQTIVPVMYVHSIMPWFLTLAACPLYYLIASVVSRAWLTLVPLMYCIFSTRSHVAARVGDITSNNVVIRAFGENDRLSVEFSDAFNDSLKCFLMATRTLKRWLVNRVSFLWSFYTTTTFLIALLNAKTLGAGTIGLCMTNLIILETLVEPNIENSTGALFELIALARIHEYMSVPQERAMRRNDDARYRSFVVKVPRAVVRSFSLVPGPTATILLNGVPFLEASKDGTCLVPAGSAKNGGSGSATNVRLDIEKRNPAASGPPTVWSPLVAMLPEEQAERLAMADRWHRIVSVGTTSGSALDMAEELCRNKSGEEEVLIDVQTGWLADGALVEIQNLRAGYSGYARDVLQNITLTFEKKTKVAVAGTTGCGKSSLLLVMLRVLEPRAGRVLLDGVDTQHVGVATLRRAIGLVPQDPVLFSGTLRHNLDPFNLFTDAAINQALDLVHLTHLVQSFPMGLYHVIADEGGNLSFGQRQLVCLARMVLRRPKLLLLDEATSAIDPSTQELVQTTLDEAFAEATVMAVAHRLETVLKYDYAVVLDQGVVAEEGSVAFLKEKKGGRLRTMLETKGEW